MHKVIIITALALLIYLFSVAEIFAQEPVEHRFILYPTQDTLTKRWYPTSSSYLTRDLSIGYDGVIPRRNTRTYLKFDYSAISEQALPMDQLISAKLYLSEYRDMANESYDVQLFEPSAEWEDRHLNWNNQPALPAELYPQTVNQITGSGVEQFDVTEIFRSQFIDENRWTLGYGIKMLDEELPGGIYWSKDCVNHLDSPRCNLNQIPYLEVLFGESIPIVKATNLAPVNERYTASKAVQFSWEHVLAGGVEFQLVIKGPEGLVYESEWSSARTASYTFSAEGSYRWHVVARKTHSNEDAESEAQILHLDWSKPGVATILSPSSGLLTNRRSVSYEAIGLQPYVTYQLYLNGTKISDRGEIQQELQLVDEGENELKLVGTDRAANSSESAVKFITDWTAPPTPSATLNIDPLNKSLALTIAATDFAEATVLQEGKLVRRLNPHEIGEPIKVVEKWVAGKMYGFTVQSKDEAGNFSKLSEVVSFSTPYEAVLGASSEAVPLSPRMEDQLGSTAQQQSSSQRNRCKVEANLDLNVINVSSCDFAAPTLKEITQIKIDPKHYWLTAVTQFKRSITLDVDYLRCKKPKLTDPISALRCETFKESSEKVVAETLGAAKLLIDDFQIPEYQSVKVEDNLRVLLSSGASHEGKSGNIQFEINVSAKLKGGIWLNIRGRSKPSESKVIKQSEDRSVLQKYFRFPFKGAIGVTQWWGKTAYNDEHTGIDFGSVKETIFAVANGKVAYVGWDGFFGPCLSGGNIMRVEHGNGMNSLYMHLDNFNKSNGIAWKAGELVKKGEQLGVTGNTGAYNCQPLAYHLHFELRAGKEQKTHTDPVPHLDIDWSKIPTLGVTKYPGRLTGNNPHPSY